MTSFITTETNVTLPISPASPPPYHINSIINADCLDVLAKMKPETVDLTVFSPPYDSIRDYKNEWNFDVSALGKALFDGNYSALSRRKLHSPLSQAFLGEGLG